MTPGTGLYVSLDQQRPEDMLRIFDSSLGSKPSLGKEDDGGQYSPSDKQQSDWGLLQQSLVEIRVKTRVFVSH